MENGVFVRNPAGGRNSQLHDVLGTLWGGKWIILGALILCVAGAAAYTNTIPTTYRTSSLLLVDLQSSDPLSSLGQSSSFAYGRQDRSLQNELLVLQQSRAIPQRVAERLVGMGTHPETQRPLSIVHGPEGRQLNEDHVARRVQGMIAARQSGRDSDAIRISASGLNSREVSLVANLFAEEYIERTKEKSRESLQASETFLESQAEKLKRDVAESEKRIETYMRKNGALALDQETNRVVGQLSELQARRDELQIELDMKRSALETQQENLSEIEPKLSERISSSIRQELNRVQEEKAQLDATIEQFEAKNPNPTDPKLQRELRQKRQRARKLERQSDSLAQEYVHQSLAAGGVASGSGGEGSPTGVAYVAEQRREIAQKRVEINGLKARLDALNERIGELRKSMRSLPTQSIEMAQLQRERRSSERIYSYVREKLQETRMALESEVGYAEIVRRASPGYPIGPGWQRNLILGFLLGSALGGGIVLLRNRLDTRIHQPDDLHDHGHRLVGVVPSMDTLIKKDFAGQESIEIDGQTVNTSLVMLTSPMSAVAESYRRIRTNLQFSRPDRELHTLAVSSADKGEGKTTTSANLAFALASAGKRTLLVDADLRRPRLHELMDIPREPGLSQLLYDESRSLDAFTTSLNDLHVVPGGEDVPNPAELMSSQRMARLVESLQEQFDYVIFDTPPVLLFSDALGLASQCDGTLLVASADKTDGRAFDHAVELLHDVEADVLGAVLNRYNASSFLQGYGQYNYGYAHSYQRLEEHYAASAPTSGLDTLKSWFDRS
jgi:capsular exopolysaccharide synthesis family protein